MLKDSANPTHREFAGFLASVLIAAAMTASFAAAQKGTWQQARTLPPTHFGVWLGRGPTRTVQEATGARNFNRLWEMQRRQNRQLVDLEIDASDARRRFIGVWEVGDERQELLLDQDWGDLQRTSRQMSRRSLLLEDLETYLVDGQRKFSGLWIRSRDSQAVFTDLDADGLREKAAQLADQGLVLVDLETYPQGGQRLYSGVWRSGAGGQRLLLGVDWRELHNDYHALGGQGLRLLDLEVYREGGQERYIGLFGPGPAPDHLWIGNGAGNFEAAKGRVENEGLKMADIEYLDLGPDDPPLEGPGALTTGTTAAPAASGAPSGLSAGTDPQERPSPVVHDGGSSGPPEEPLPGG